MSKYVLENKGEAARLEEQSTLTTYLVEDEMQFLKWKSGQRILDAGCGTGLVSRYLTSVTRNCKIEGCDLSNDRLEHARSQNKSIHYFQAPLETIPVENETYDTVTCRYVFEHLNQPQKVADEFYRVIKKNGTAYVIDFDGLFYNLFPTSPELQKMLDTMKAKLPFDLNVGRKIPDLLKKAGFREISWEISAHTFQNEELKNEYKMNEERLTFAIPLFTELFGSETAAHRFKKLYLQEMMAPGATLFYNKFVVIGKK